MDPAIKKVIEDAVLDAPDPHVASQRIRDAASEAEKLKVAPFVWAFGYLFLTDRETDSRARYGYAYCPSMEFATGTFPPPLGELDEPTLAALAEYAEATDRALPRARINDLLWERRFGDTAHLYAREAIKGFAELAAQSDWHDIHKANALGRAIELSTQLNDDALASKAITDAVAFTRVAVKSERWNPGVTLRLIESIMLTRTALWPDDLAELLQLAEDRYGHDPFIFQSIADLQLNAGGDKSDRSRALIEKWFDAAERADGLVAHAHLRKALEQAELRSQPDLANRAKLALQNLKPDPDDFKTVSAEIPIDRKEFDDFARPIVGDDSFIKAIQRLGLNNPPIAPEEELRQDLAAEMAEFPVQNLFNQVVMGPENSVISEAIDDGAKLQNQLVQRRAFAARIWAIFLTDALDRIFETYEPPDRTALAEVFKGDVVTDEAANAFARAVLLYGEGEFDLAVHAIVPRIEATIREMARMIGIVVLKLPNGARPGGVVGLGAILHSLSGRLPDIYRDYFSAVLSDPLGANLRNSVSHGLADEFSRSDAAILINVAQLLGHMRAGNATIRS